MDNLQTRLNLAAAKWQTYSSMMGYCQGWLAAKGEVPSCGDVDKEMMKQRQEQSRAAYAEFLTELREVSNGRD